MRKMAIPLGLALALGVLQNYSVGQTPTQKLDTTPQTRSISAVARNPTKAQSDKSTQNQDRNWQLKLGPVLVGASYSRFGDPFTILTVCLRSMDSTAYGFGTRIGLTLFRIRPDILAMTADEVKSN